MTLKQSISEGAADFPPPGLTFSIVYGGIGFAVVSVLAYSIWAFRWVPGTAAMYLSIAAVYLGLSGLALSRLVTQHGAWKRFPPIFAVGFLLYAVAWCVFWFGFRGRYFADLWGALLGLAAMIWWLRRAFHSRAGFLRMLVVVFSAHSLGYYLGGELYSHVRGAPARLLWGACHGLGFGAGLGYVLFRVQLKTK